MGEINFYGGAGYGSPNPEEESLIGYKPGEGFSLGTFSFPADPRTLDKVKSVSQKVNTGAKNVELNLIEMDYGAIESVPKQQWEEINRLRKLTGIDFTMHGPVPEPTGLTKQGWTEEFRKESEDKMWSAVQIANTAHPKGNVVVTFHSSNGLPDPESREIDPNTGKEKISEFWVVDEAGERFKPIKPEPNYLTNVKPGAFTKAEDFSEEIDLMNKEEWQKKLAHTSFNAEQGKHAIGDAWAHVVSSAVHGNPSPEAKEFLSRGSTEGMVELYKLRGTDKWEQFVKEVKPEIASAIEEGIERMNYGDLYTKDSYNELQRHFNDAWKVATKNEDEKTLKKLKEYREEMLPIIEAYKKDPYSNLEEFSDAVVKGVNTLNSITPPQAFKPMKKWAIDKASETFSNVAKKAYDEYGIEAPIISIENPPAGMGLSRAEDLKELVEETREKFITKAMKSGVSKSDAEKYAERLVGATWDVGHINMIKKFGYDKEKLLKETETIAPFVKHIHLSDNFGSEHTELPMGMGNVPIKEHFEIIGDKVKDLKKTVEVGPLWYRDFQKTPVRETAKVFNSPIYSARAEPSWNQTIDTNPYSAGFGFMLPEGNFGTWGGPFSNLPAELGGQMSGKDRITGTPME
jgi:sugar phosphate isomerase/epimerase